MASRYLMTREPATPDQKTELSATLARLEHMCAVVLELLTTMYGPDDNRAIRAGELCGALQRLTWDVVRASDL
jgi:hypothetical protein